MLVDDRKVEVMLVEHFVCEFAIHISQSSLVLRALYAASPSSETVETGDFARR